MKLKKVHKVEGAEHLEKTLEDNGLFKILMGRKNQYWCTIASDRPEALVVLSASGGKIGHKTAFEAFEAALSLALPRVPLLNNPAEWVA